MAERNTMNKIRRKELASIVAKLEALDALRLEINEMLESVRDEEQEALDNMPESLQDGEKGQQMQEYIDTMADVLDELENLDIEGFMDQLQEIIG